jgi:rhodanese-related sulfurtransferase
MLATDGEYPVMNALFRWFKRSPPPPDWIESADLAARLPGNAGPLVLDVRGPDEFDGPLGHITGATNIPLNELPAHLTELVHQGRQIVVVCKTDRRSQMAAQQLRKAGMPNVSVLRGGMEQWRAESLPVC